MATPALPRALAALLLLLLASTARSQEEAPSPTAEPPASAPLAADSQLAHSPISNPPTASAPSAAADAPSPPPPAPPKTSPVAAPSSDSPAPAHAPSHTHLAPAADEYKGDDNKSPSPAPAADQIKAANVTAASIGSGELEEHREMNGGSKAGVVLGTFAAAAVLGLGVFVWRKRRANIRRARYADYAARLELV
ncbi:unnamed protein product [Miscanthus lutarioriparius]|uniref:Uncharacterized protein n=1 Tax=Miscanthus lutarioriparius TaxID=422564 RepID=A0A811MQB6_9POAL|nr:unnamed protein product [Miscanthus lutarioriparius]